MVNDLVVENAIVIFILESPHTEELAGGLPLLGDSGIVFSQALLSDKEKPAGAQINEGGIPYSIMNTFEEALQLSPSLSQLNFAICRHDFKKLGLVRYKKEISREIFESPLKDRLIESYRERFNSIVECSQENIKIVICGIIAQVFFELALDISDIWFGQVTKKQIMGRDFEILYVEHPSPKNSDTHWSHGANKLRRFVSID